MTDPTIAEQIGRELGMFFSIVFFIIGVAGAWKYGGKIYHDWRERRRVKRIMKETFPEYTTPGHRG